MDLAPRAHPFGLSPSTTSSCLQVTTSSSTFGPLLLAQCLRRLPYMTSASCFLSHHLVMSFQIMDSTKSDNEQLKKHLSVPYTKLLTALGSLPRGYWLEPSFASSSPYTALKPLPRTAPRTSLSTSRSSTPNQLYEPLCLKLGLPSASSSHWHKNTSFRTVYISSNMLILN